MNFNTIKSSDIPIHQLCLNNKILHKTLIIKILTISICFTLIICPVHAEEGLWIPILLHRYNIDIMQKEGLKLSAEDIYSINQASLKDAIVIFGSGCTGELISDEGLVLTNHHCGISAIQSHSSVDNDYLTNGFWAMSRDQELPNASLKVTFLIRMEDVTAQVLDSISYGSPEELRDSMVNAHIRNLKEKATGETGYKAVIKPFYYGNEYYMFIYQEYSDVRFVGAPPNAIGNFGEDLDNWIWPRHTGDFSLFRIYAGPNNEPAPYSPENVPYKSKKHLAISTSGIEEEDFTMVLGYPGTTNEYIISDEIRNMLTSSLPKKVALRDARLKIIDKYMKQNDTTRIMYAAKYRNISNAWKKWEGVIIGLENTDALSKKKLTEDRFQEWVQADSDRLMKYGNVIPGLRELSKKLSRYSLVYEYSGENVMAPEIIDFALDCSSFFSSSIDLGYEQKVAAAEGFKNTINGFFKNYNQSIDKEIFALMLQSYRKDIDKEFHPDFFKLIDTKYKSDYNKFASSQFERSVISHKQAILPLLDQFPGNSEKIYKRIMKDPFINVFRAYSQIYTAHVVPYYNEISSGMQILYRTYLQGLMEMQADKVFYPDANFTMRVAYGKADGYKPADGIEYECTTTLTGVIEKFNSDPVNYPVPATLVDIYNKKDYGRWADKNGNLQVCFVASNHTSGGNSGSPILNANGYLVGINFDRNWEGTMSDFYYDASICRNIGVDIRYILFIIDKFASAGYLINEMDIQNDF